MATMQAVLSEVVGGTDALVLRDMPVPQAGPGQLLIRVRACGINYPDALVIRDLYQVKHPRPFAPGMEVSGDVIAVGPEVSGFAVGDAVVGTLDHGGLAQIAAAYAVRCIHKPPAMPYDEAAGFLLTYGTSYHALRQRARLVPGETLLVLGAAGGVGIAAVQIGAAMGARVIAACSSQDKVDFALHHGAHAGVVYPTGPFDRDGRKQLAGLFKEAVGKDGANVIYDAVGGDYAEAALRAIAWEGRFLVVGFPSGIPAIPLNLTLLKSCDILGVLYGIWKNREPAQDHENKAALQAMYAAGQIRPPISERYPLARAAEAIDKLSSRGALGKVVVMID